MINLVITLLVAVFAGYIFCQPSDNLECNRAVEGFNTSLLCSITYEGIVGDIDSIDTRERNCASRSPILCLGECAERLRLISCSCDDENPLIVNVGKACGCQSNITCPNKTDDCGRAVYAFKKECTGLVSNNSCSTLCDENENCNNLAKNVSCHCPAMSEGHEMIRKIDTSCNECSFDCSSATDLLSSPLLLLAAAIISIATWQV